MTLYEILGIKPDATQKEVRSAYKRMAQKYHPDRESGDAERFNKIAHAFNVLGSETRREKYDMSGDESEPPNIERMINAAMAEIFSNLVEAPTHVNIRKEAEKLAQNAMFEPKQKRDQLLVKKAKLQRQIGRVKTEEQENIFNDAVHSAISNISSAIEHLDTQITVLEQVAERLILYSDNFYQPNYVETANTGSTGTFFNFKV